MGPGSPNFCTRQLERFQVPLSSGTPRGYAGPAAAALRQELGGSRAAVKTLTRWTGAGERAAWNWLSAVDGPIGTTTST